MSTSQDFHAIPDGEYDLEISETLQQLIFAKSPTSSAQRKNDEVLSISFSDAQKEYGVDLTKQFTLTRNDVDKFAMNTESSKFKKGVTLTGDITQSKGLNSLLVFNPVSGIFELQHIDNELHTREIKETENIKEEEESRPTPPPQVKSPSIPPPTLKKRVHKEPSIFQPKHRARTPSQGAASLPKPKKLTANSPRGESPPPSSSSAPDKPFTPSNPTKERSIPPSPLITHSFTSTKTSEMGSPKAAGKVQTSEYSSTNTKSKPVNNKTSTPKPTVVEEEEFKSADSTPKSRPSTSDKRPRMSQYGSKKPPSTVTTPVTVASPTPEPVSDEDEDEELDNLADELEDELELAFDDMDNDDNSAFITVEEEAPLNMDFNFGDDDSSKPTGNGNGGSPKKKPISFRDLVGDDGRDDEEALSSSSEEE